ncbi:plasma membrane calcium-transporting ATPase 3-like [Paramacrobiotus metropolitanus]|uniref:plasma membrane calcium-transporting ATPase 3-like n=1 Tax=Paramacrobiotus metropolitanus TaxID=2943436 RepID=UPI002445CE42|nr:plasma membrane calcium-transporting ATPase 3-like [Paramacrobiotus metropolitanus]XP_055332696.1 plasma membrane calcium-transporting ATPase 3-like [Paramacrobiotus metropolitanus]
MCPFEPYRDKARRSSGLRRPSRKDSQNDDGDADAIALRSALEYGVSAEDLCRLMQLRGIGVRERIDELYGDLAGLSMQLLASPSRGLDESAQELQKRQETFGKNVIPMKKPKSFMQLMLKALREPTLIILEVAAVVSLALAVWNVFRPGADNGTESYEWIEGLAIAIGVLIIVLVSASNDYGKEQQFRALQARVQEEHKISVIRQGQTVLLPVQELLVGDICQVKYGDLIPADGVVLQSQELRLDESSLTGESDPVRKNPDNDCQILSGTHVIEGSGRFLVLAVGVNSQTGAIYKLLGAVKDGKTKDKVPNGITVPAEDEDGSASTEDSIDLPLHGPSARKSVDQQRKQTNHSVFQSKLNILAYKIGILGFIFSAATSLVIIIRFCVQNYAIDGNSWKSQDATTILDSIIVGITILVSAIPEGLPLAVTLTLAFSAKKMMQDNNLVRHLYACETMGCATTICSDKTGTLTTNRMTVMQAWFGGEIYDPLPDVKAASQNVLKIVGTAVAVNCNYTSDVIPAKDGVPQEHRGNKTECALLSFVSSLGTDYHKVRRMYPEGSLLKVYTFNSGRKSMSTVVEIPGGWRVFTKGAAEIIVSKCRFMLTESGSLLECSDASQMVTNSVISLMTNSALRTICIAYKDYLLNTDDVDSLPNVEKVSCQPDFDDENSIISNLTCLCIVGIEDPVRPEVPNAIRQCQRAGVTVRMITGDNIQTARSIAIKCGIIAPQDDSIVLDGRQFNVMIRDSNGQIDPGRLNSVWPKLRVLARSTPEDKFTLVDGIINSRISKHREVVAVTGDGTNDAPALRKADVGFAMGIAGTDVAKEASDIILTDDNFISIVKACMWGRNIYDNVAKFLQFQLTVNVAALSVAIVSACAIGDTPLKAVPMLWINMIQDTLGSLALATEPPGEALLKRKPYGRKKRIISRVIARNILGQGLYQTVVLLLMLFLGPYYFDVHEERQIGHVVGEPTFLYTMIFNCLVMMTSFNLINARCIHNEVNVFQGIQRNLYFLILWTVMVVTQVLVVQFGGYVFSTQPLTLDSWMICLFFGFGSLLWYHVLRLIPVRRKSAKKSRLF